MDEQPPLRKPFALIVAAELVVVAALGVVAWHVWHSGGPTPAAIAARPSVVASADARTARPTPGRTPSAPAVARPLTPRPAGPTPGLARDPTFISDQMNRINHDQSSLMRTEWQVVSAFVRVAQDYLRKVVLPIVEGAQQDGR